MFFIVFKIPSPQFLSFLCRVFARLLSSFSVYGGKDYKTLLLDWVMRAGLFLKSWNKATVLLSVYRPLYLHFYGVSFECNLWEDMKTSLSACEHSLLDYLVACCMQKANQKVYNQQSLQVSKL